jgi:hypothetical protein
VNNQQGDLVMPVSSLKALEIEARKINGTTFVSIRGYRNKFGELSDYLINLGVKHHSVLRKDLVRHDLFYTDNKERLIGLYGEELVVRAYTEKRESMVASLAGENKHADAQYNAYITVIPGIKYCPSTGNWHINGYLIRKTVREKGVYPKVNKRKLTIVKDEFSKGSKASKCRTFIIDNAEIVKISGLEIPFKMAA